MKVFTTDKLNHALYLLNEQLEMGACSDIELVVCGGSALIATRLVSWTCVSVDHGGSIRICGKVAECEGRQ